MSVQLRAHGLRTNISKLIRRDTLEGREHIVAPVILIKAGVHNNVLYTEAELSKHTDAWNGRPLVAPNHPTVAGKPVTANSKRVLEKMGIGQVLNVNWDAENKALKGEAWVDVEKAKKRCSKVLEQLEAEAPQVEVSTGLFTDDTFHANAELDGKRYYCEAKNHRPDHLAILPDAKGACSWEDGAGLPRINAAMDDDAIDQEAEPEEDTATDKLGPVVNRLLASEFLAWFCYYMGAQLAEGKSRTVIAQEFEAHADEELDHADALIQLLQERGLPVTVTIADVAALPRAKAVLTAATAELLTLNAELESAAVTDYKAAIDELDGEDPTAALLLTEHMKTEQAHKHDLQQLATELDMKVNAVEGGRIEDEDAAGTCAKCGAALDEDGECPECDAEGETVGQDDNPPTVKVGAKSQKQNEAGWFARLFSRSKPKVNAKAELSHNQLNELLGTALRDHYAPPPAVPGNGDTPLCCPSPWITEVYDDHVIFNFANKLFSLDYTVDKNNAVKFNGDAEEVVRATSYEPVKQNAEASPFWNKAAAWHGNAGTN